jgi:hypothetical protein
MEDRGWKKAILLLPSSIYLSSINTQVAWLVQPADLLPAHR